MRGVEREGRLELPPRLDVVAARVDDDPEGGVRLDELVRRERLVAGEDLARARLGRRVVQPLRRLADGPQEARRVRRVRRLGLRGTRGDEGSREEKGAPGRHRTRANRTTDVPDEVVSRAA